MNVLVVDCNMCFLNLVHAKIFFLHVHDLPSGKMKKVFFILLAPFLSSQPCLYVIELQPLTYSRLFTRQNGHDK